MSQSITLAISGMHCGSCAGRIENQLREVPGVTDAAVALQTKRAAVNISEDTEPTTLVHAVESAGYKATIIT